MSVPDVTELTQDATRGSLHGVVGRTRRKKWWVIEWRPHGQKTWRELARHNTRPAAERQMVGMLKIHSEIPMSKEPTRARLVEIEASERRMTVERMQRFRAALEAIAEYDTGFSTDAEHMNQMARDALNESPNDKLCGA